MENCILNMQGRKKRIKLALCTSVTLLTLFATALPKSLQAQTFAFEFQSTIPLILNADTLANAWAGGINAGQYSTIHLNNDTIEDLVVFERFTNTVSTFVAIQKKGKYV